MLVEEHPTTEQEFVDWVRPHLVSMARLAGRLAPDAERDDIVQEALTRAWQKRSQYDASRGTPAAWLCAITADQARKASRRVWLRRVRPEPDPPPSASVDGHLDLYRALPQLTARQRLAVDCYYFVGLSVAETAAVMQCSEGTVKSTLADARARLRTLLEVTG